LRAKGHVISEVPKLVLQRGTLDKAVARVDVQVGFKFKALLEGIARAVVIIA